MFSIYAKVTTPETSPILGPAQSPNQIIDPLDYTHPNNGVISGIELLYTCCSRTPPSGMGMSSISSVSGNANNVITNTNTNSIQTNVPITDDILEKCKQETHFTQYNYRAITPRQMPPF